MSACRADFHVPAGPASLASAGQQVDGRSPMESCLHASRGMAPVRRATHVEQAVAAKLICPEIRNIPAAARRKGRALPLLLVVVVAPQAAFAQAQAGGGGDAAAARILFYDARQLMERGRFNEACPKLEESLRLDAGMGTRFNLADCNEHIGKLATAWAGFLEVAAESRATNQAERATLARKRAALLEPRLPKLVVEVTASGPALQVQRDGVLIGTAVFGTAIPVDAGTHRVVATAPGKQWETVVQTVESATAWVSIPRDLPARVGPVTVAATARDDGSTANAARTSIPRVIEHPGGTQRAVGWVVAGLGVIGLGVGAGFGLSSISKRDDSRDHCVVDRCDARGVGLRDDAIESGNIATVATIAGGAAVVGGVVLVLIAPKGTREQAGELRALPTVGQRDGGFTLQGKFP